MLESCLRGKCELYLDTDPVNVIRNDLFTQSNESRAVVIARIKLLYLKGLFAEKISAITYTPSSKLLMIICI